MEDKFKVALVKELCIICAKEMDGPIIMNTILSEKEANKVKEMHGKVIGFSDKPCEECQENLEKAFLFIGFDEQQSDLDNLPEGFYRTGQIVGTKKDIPLVQEFVKNNQPQAIEKGYIFMPDVIMLELGLIKEKRLITINI